MNDTPHLPDYSAEKDRHLRRNLWVAAPVDGAWGFAGALVAVGPIITVLLQRLGATNLVIGLAPALLLVGYALLQLPSAHFSRRLRAKKTALIFLHLPPSLVWVLAGFLVTAWGLDRPRLLIWSLLAILAFFALTLGVIMPLWGQLLGRMFSDRRRGVGMGVIFLVNGVGGVLGGLYATHLLAARDFPANFGHLFVVAGALMVLSIFAYFAAYEHVPLSSGEVRPEAWREALRRLWADPRLRRLVLVRNLFESGAAATNFLAVFFLARFALPDEAAGGFTLAMSVGMITLSPVGGRIGDRHGYRRVLALGMALMAAALSLALGSPLPAFAYGVFLLLGMAQASDWVGGINLLLEMCREQDRAYYQALLPSALIPVRLCAPLFLGWLGDRVGLSPVLLLGLVLILAGWVALLALVDDPRRPGRRVWPWGLRLRLFRF